MKRGLELFPKPHSKDSGSGADVSMCIGRTPLHRRLIPEYLTVADLDDFQLLLSLDRSMFT